MSRNDEFELAIALRGEKAWATVYRAPAGEPPAAVLDRAALEKLLHEARRLPREPTLREVRRPSQTAASLGQRLFELAFPGEIARSFRRSLRERERGRRLHLVLRLGEAGTLADLPWELLYDPEERMPLAASGVVTLARYLEEPTPPRPPVGGRPLRVLVAAAEPAVGWGIDVEAELTAMRTALADLTPSRVELEVLRGVTASGLREALRAKPRHVLHLVAHGSAAGSEPVLLLDPGEADDGRVEASRLVAAIGDRAELVVLSSCDGGRDVAGSALSGLAPRLVRQGVAAVVAMRGPIADRAAIAFSRALYEELACGKSLRDAVALARQALYVAGHHHDFALPALFARRCDLPLVTPAAPVAGDLSGALRRLRPKRAVLAPLVVAVVLLAVAFGGPPFRRGEPVPFPLVAPGKAHLEAPVEGPVHDPRCPSVPGLYLPMRYIAGGSYEVGSDDGERDERPRHRVSLDPYCLGITEVTQEQWSSVMGDLPMPSVRAPDRPMDRVTWNEAQELVRRLDARVEDGSPFRLPTEAEWEVAARAGTGTAFSFGDEPAELRHHGNCLSPGVPDDRHDSVAPVASFAANPWGLYDLHGNVSEWVEDRYRPYPGAAPGTVPLDEPERRVRRGGSYRVKPENCRSSRRYASTPDYRSPDVGLRLAAEPLPEPPPTSPGGSTSTGSGG